MNSLIPQISSLQNSNINEIVKERLKDFSSFKNKSNKEWFSELCFCILTANSKALTAIAVQKEIQEDGFLNFSQHKISKIIKKNKHRFHNNKAKYIIEARKHKNIKDLLKEKTEEESRNWLVENVKGLGYKEASHFLRNTGSRNLAILDRHIINLMFENRIIKKPKTLTKSNYLAIESRFNALAKELKMTPTKLDLLMWYLKTGKVLK